MPCKIVRPIRTVHCYTCDICISEYDHHCPWIGKCVGRDNLGQFKVFLFSVMMLFVAFGVSLYVASLYDTTITQGIKNGIVWLNYHYSTDYHFLSIIVRFPLKRITFMSETSFSICFLINFSFRLASNLLSIGFYDATYLVCFGEKYLTSLVSEVKWFSLLEERCFFTSLMGDPLIVLAEDAFSLSCSSI